MLRWYTRLWVLCTIQGLSLNTGVSVSYCRAHTEERILRMKL